MEATRRRLRDAEYPSPAAYCALFASMIGSASWALRMTIPPSLHSHSVLARTAGSTATSVFMASGPVGLDQDIVHGDDAAGGGAAKAGDDRRQRHGRGHGVGHGRAALDAVDEEDRVARGIELHPER